MYDIVTVTVNYKMKDKVLAMLRSLFRDTENRDISNFAAQNLETSLFPRVQSVVVDNDSRDSIKDALVKEFSQRIIFIDAGANIGFGRGNKNLRQNIISLPTQI